MPRVVYVAGWLRSGSTLLCQSLGSVPGTLALGEVSGVWKAAALDQPCSCGDPIRTCAVWGPALAAVRDAFGVAMPDLEAVAALAKRVLRTRDSRRLGLLAAQPRSAWPGPVARYVELTGKLLQGAADAAGVTTLVDSSKLPPGFLALQLHGDIEVDVVHLIRDPRAVVNAERRRDVQPDVDPALVPPVRAAPKSAAYWSAANLAVRSFGRQARSYQVLRYEDFAATPDACLARLSSDLGLGALAESIESGGRRAGHLAVGNPSRFVRASQVIREDRSWQGELPWRDLAVVAVLSRPVYALLT